MSFFCPVHRLLLLGGFFPVAPTAHCLRLSDLNSCTQHHCKYLGFLAPCCLETMSWGRSKFLWIWAFVALLIVGAVLTIPRSPNNTAHEHELSARLIGNAGPSSSMRELLQFINSTLQALHVNMKDVAGSDEVVTTAKQTDSSTPLLDTNGKETSLTNEATSLVVALRNLFSQVSTSLHQAASNTGLIDSDKTKNVAAGPKSIAAGPKSIAAPVAVSSNPVLAKREIIAMANGKCLDNNPAYANHVIKLYGCNQGCLCCLFLSIISFVNIQRSHYILMRFFLRFVNGLQGLARASGRSLRDKSSLRTDIALKQRLMVALCDCRSAVPVSPLPRVGSWTITDKLLWGPHCAASNQVCQRFVGCLIPSFWVAVEGGIERVCV